LNLLKIQDFKISRFQEFQDFKISRFQESLKVIFKISRFQESPPPLTLELPRMDPFSTHLGTSRFQDFKISRIQEFKISRFQDFKISGFQEFKISRFQEFKISRIQDFKVACRPPSLAGLLVGQGCVPRPPKAAFFLEPRSCIKWQP